jgi:SAM-dependent methyltransferase
MFKKKLIRFLWILSSQFGIDINIFFKSFLRIPIFIKEYYIFKKLNKNKNQLYYFKPCLHDRFEEGGVTNSEYFWQDLMVARLIFEANPKSHIDIGSRIDGFVAHVASYREINVVDIRPINTKINGIIFKQLDIMDSSYFTTNGTYFEKFDSVSCLHTIEHFGLGRYGDPIDPDGYTKGLSNIISMLKPDGLFYLSTPIGKERVEFNANRVFDPVKLIKFINSKNMKLIKISCFKNSELVDIPFTDAILDSIKNSEYQLGIFVFEKL